MNIPDNLAVPARAVGFPPSFAACPECNWIMFLTHSDVTSHYQCSYGCKKQWMFQRIAWAHPHLAKLNEQLSDVSRRVLFGTCDGKWPSGMQPVIFQCACCGVGKVGWWTPEATSGFYLLSAWPEKLPTVEQIMRAHGGWDSDRDSAFLCDECADHVKRGEHHV